MGRLIQRGPWSAILLAARTLAFAGLALAATALVMGSGAFRASEALVVATGAYLLAHAMRALRLVLLSAHPLVPARRVFFAHFYTAAVSAITPLKLGDALRIGEMASLTGSAPRGLAIYWAERASDAFILIIFCILLLAMSDATVVAALPFMATLVLFVMGTVTILIVLPEHIRRVKVFALRKYSNERAAQIIEVVNASRSFGEACRDVARDKLFTTVLLSGVIWMLEAIAFAQATAAIDAVAAVAGLTAELSAMNLTPADGALLPWLAGAPDGYAGVVFAVLTTVGVVAAVFYFHDLFRSALKARSLAPARRRAASA